MKKYFGSAICCLISFLFFATVANSEIVIIIINCDFQIKGDSLEIIFSCCEESTIIKTNKNQITVVERYGEQYNIAIHERGTAYNSNVFYRIDPEKLGVIEKKIFVDWSKIE